MRRETDSISKWCWFAELCLLAILMLPGLALADDECSYVGSWYGSNSMQLDFVVTVHGKRSGGTLVLEFPGIDSFVPFPGVARTSSFRGTWEEIHRRSIAFTLVGYSVDSSGQTIVIIKISGFEELSQDCNSGFIESTTELFAPEQDPFGGEDPVYGWFQGAHPASRMRVDPPASF